MIEGNPDGRFRPGPDDNRRGDSLRDASLNFSTIRMVVEMGVATHTGEIIHYEETHHEEETDWTTDAPRVATHPSQQTVSRPVPRKNESAGNLSLLYSERAVV